MLFWLSSYPDDTVLTWLIPLWNEVVPFELKSLFPLKNAPWSPKMFPSPPGSCVAEWWPPWGERTTSAWASEWWSRASRSAAARPPSWPWRPTPPSLTGSCALLQACPPPSPASRTWLRPSLAVRNVSFCSVCSGQESGGRMCLWGGGGEASWSSRPPDSVCVNKQKCETSVPLS